MVSFHVVDFLVDIELTFFRNYFIAGKARITVFESDAARTFDFQAGDVGYIPGPDGHYIENIGTEPLHLLEILITSEFSDLSMGQWLALTVSRFYHFRKNVTLTSIATSGCHADPQYHDGNLQLYVCELQKQAVPCQLSASCTRLQLKSRHHNRYR